MACGRHWPNEGGRHDRLVRGGTIVARNQSVRADVPCQGGRIVAVGPAPQVPTGAEIGDTGGIEDRKAWCGTIGSPRDARRKMGWCASRRPTPRRCSNRIRARLRAAGRRCRPGAVARAGEPDDIGQAHHRNVDRNVYEVLKMAGPARHTNSRGKRVWANGDLRAVRSAGRHAARPCFAPPILAIAEQNRCSAPTPVKR